MPATGSEESGIGAALIGTVSKLTNALVPHDEPDNSPAADSWKSRGPTTTGRLGNHSSSTAPPQSSSAKNPNIAKAPAAASTQSPTPSTATKSSSAKNPKVAGASTGGN
ncbi:hypothetical protein P691DRAFT_803574, partial [Macrolepiota fuliginosa MF-IS2]